MSDDGSAEWGQGESPPTRAEMALERQALRNDWPIPPRVKVKILNRLVSYLDVECEEGATCSDRQVLMAAQTLAMFARLGLEQQKVDLIDRKLAGVSGGFDLAEFAAEAEKIANGRGHEPDPASGPPVDRGPDG